MRKLSYLKSTLAGGASMAVLATGALAGEFNVPSGDLRTALNLYAKQAGVELIYPVSAVEGSHTRGAKGNLSSDEALAAILKGTGFATERTRSGAIGIVRDMPVRNDAVTEVAQASPARAAAAGIESVVVTSSKIKGDIQTVPIAITALSQEQLTSRQIAGGPDLVKEVPNLTFSKTNFSGYNIQIRGIGTQAISVTTDPAVAVAFNDIPFIRNHFFEQEFYDVNQVEVLRGPQGTLYGRNATAGVVNVISAKPTDQFEAMASADIGNYHNRRFEAMVNIPIVDDRLDLRVAGEWTKRDGYSFNTLTNRPIDGRDLWSTRATLAWKPVESLNATLIWEHFQEDDDRLRSAKQLCKTAPIPDSVGGIKVSEFGGTGSEGDYLSQGCEMTSLYSPDAFQVPNGFSLPYYSGFVDAGVPVRSHFDVYASTTQSRNLRSIESQINPSYKAKNDTVELNIDYGLTPVLSVTSQTGYNSDFLWGAEDYNRFNSAPGVFTYNPNNFDFPGLVTLDPAAGTNNIPADAGIFCDPQLGCSDRLVAEDLSQERAWQLSQEVRLASNFSGPFNFSIGGNYLHYETVENYYVFINTLNLFEGSGVANRFPSANWLNNIADWNASCRGGAYRFNNPNLGSNVLGSCDNIDPNPIENLSDLGHTYFLSQNPYVLNSYAAFGEVYYNVTNELKLTGGLRWTDDKKHFLDIPSELLVGGMGYPITNIVDQQWNQLTGRGVINWTPKLNFTDQTLVYGSYAHGYKAGGANPPGAIYPNYGSIGGDAVINPIHPLTFKPEFVDAFELGSKNTLLDGTLTFDGDVFYYNYKDYQISRIVDRTAINDNFDAHIKGAELETSWEAAPGLKFNFAGGYEDARLAKGSHSVDLMDRTAGNPNWMVVKPFVTNSSNCVLPIYVVAALLELGGNNMASACTNTYNGQEDPIRRGPYTPNPTNFYNGGPFCPPVCGYPGFDPLAGTPNDPYTGQNIDNGIDYGPAPNNGQGFDKNLSNNQLPNAPHFTTSFGVEYTLPVSENWAATMHGDFYWQSQSFARVFNDRPYDKLRGYSNVNLALILTSADGWQVMGYLKNVFNATAITGDFLNSDDSGLTTNVFLTDPRLFGVRVTKNW